MKAAMAIFGMLAMILTCRVLIIVTADFFGTTAAFVALGGFTFLLGMITAFALDAATF